MPCCGKKRATVRETIKSAAPPDAGTEVSPRPQGSSVVFEYVGRTAMTVISPVWGQRYHFDRPGAKSEVDGDRCGSACHRAEPENGDLGLRR